MPYPDLQNTVQRAGFTITDYSDQRKRSMNPTFKAAR